VNPFEFLDEFFIPKNSPCAIRGEDFVILACVVFTQCQRRVTDRRTDAPQSPNVGDLVQGERLQISVEWGVYRKVEVFFSFCRKPATSLKRSKIGPMLLLIANGKSHTLFRLVPKSTTFDDLQRPLRALLHNKCVYRSPPWNTWMTTDPHYQQQKCSFGGLVASNIKLFMRIFAGSLEKGRHTTVGWSKTPTLSAFGRYILEHLESWGNQNLETKIIMW